MFTIKVIICLILLCAMFFLQTGYGQNVQRSGKAVESDHTRPSNPFSHPNDQEQTSRPLQNTAGSRTTDTQKTHAKSVVRNHTNTSKNLTEEATKTNGLVLHNAERYLEPSLFEISEIQPLNFGRFVSGNHGGYITVSPCGITIISGDIAPFENNFQPAIYQITARRNIRLMVFIDEEIGLNNDDFDEVILITELLTEKEIENGLLINAGDDRIYVKIGGKLRVPPKSSNWEGEFGGKFKIEFRVMYE